MRIMLLKPALAQLLGRRHEDGLAEVLRPELPHERQPRRCEQHLLPHGRRIGHVRHGEQARGIVVAAEEDVERFVGLDVLLQAGKVVAEAGGFKGEGRAGDEGFAFDGDDEAKGVGAGEEGGELSLELLGGWQRSVASPL